MAERTPTGTSKKPRARLSNPAARSPVSASGGQVARCSQGSERGGRAVLDGAVEDVAIRTPWSRDGRTGPRWPEASVRRATGMPADCEVYGVTVSSTYLTFWPGQVARSAEHKLGHVGRLAHRLLTAP